MHEDHNLNPNPNPSPDPDPKPNPRPDPDRKPYPRHMHEDKRDDDDSEEEEEEQQGEEEGEEDGEEEEEEEVAFQPRKKVKPLTQGRAAIKMGADFFGDSRYSTFAPRFLANRKRATRSLGCAPFLIQYCTRSTSRRTRSGLSFAIAGL